VSHSETGTFLARFRVYAERGRPHYYTVWIFRTREAMLQWVRESDTELNLTTGLTATYDFEAITRHWTTHRLCGRRWVLSPDIGVVLFYAGNIGGGIVSHEMTHAAIAWSQRVAHLRPQRIFHHEAEDASDENERFCHAQGWMVAQFWKKFYRRVTGDPTGRVRTRLKRLSRR